MKYAIIRKVPFKTPDRKARIVWAHVLAENEGLALLLVPKPEHSQPHSIYIATEDITERVFESVTPYRIDLETSHLKDAGNRLRLLAESFEDTDFWRLFRHDEFP